MRAISISIVLFLFSLSWANAQDKVLPPVKRLFIWNKPNYKYRISVKAHVIANFNSNRSDELIKLPSGDEEVTNDYSLNWYPQVMGHSKSKDILIVLDGRSESGIFKIKLLNTGKTSKKLNLPIRTLVVFLPEPYYQRDDSEFLEKFSGLSLYDSKTVCLIGENTYLARHNKMAWLASKEEKRVCLDDVSAAADPALTYPRADHIHGTKEAIYGFSHTVYFFNENNDYILGLKSRDEDYFSIKPDLMFHDVCLIQDTDHCEKSAFFLINPNTLEIYDKCMLWGMTHSSVDLYYKNKLYLVALGSPFEAHGGSRSARMTVLQFEFSGPQKSSDQIDRGLCWPNKGPIPPPENPYSWW